MNDPVAQLPARKKSPNPLFLTLSVLSAIPTAFFLLGAAVGESGFLFFVSLWCGMWTWVWWAMADRYR